MPSNSKRVNNLLWSELSRHSQLDGCLEAQEEASGVIKLSYCRFITRLLNWHFPRRRTHWGCLLPVHETPPWQCATDSAVGWHTDVMPESQQMYPIIKQFATVTALFPSIYSPQECFCPPVLFSAPRFLNLGNRELVLVLILTTQGVHPKAD